MRWRAAGRAAGRGAGGGRGEAGQEGALVAHEDGAPPMLHQPHGRYSELLRRASERVIRLFRRRIVFVCPGMVRTGSVLLPWKRPENGWFAPTNVWK